MFDQPTSTLGKERNRRDNSSSSIIELHILSAFVSGGEDTSRLKRDWLSFFVSSSYLKLPLPRWQVTWMTHRRKRFMWAIEVSLCDVADTIRNVATCGKVHSTRGKWVSKSAQIRTFLKATSQKKNELLNSSGATSCPFDVSHYIDVTIIPIKPRRHVVRDLSLYIIMVAKGRVVYRHLLSTSRTLSSR